MKLYRADKRDFSVGELIRTAGEFVTLNPEGSQRVEECFEQERPTDKPLREKCLYLFESLDVAKKHWSKMTGGMLYEIDIDESMILHRADMQLVDAAYRESDENALKKCAIDYWAGVETPSPRIEILVSEAIVSRVVSKDQKERVEFFKSWALA